MNYRLGTLGLIAAMVLSLPSHAQDTYYPYGGDEEGAKSVKAKLKRHFYIAPMGNYFRAAEARGTDDGFGGQISLGKSVTNGLNLELVTQYLTADPKSGSGSAKLTGVGLGAMIFPVNSLPDLYVPMSLMRGQVKSNPGPIPDYSTTFFDIGLGYLIGLGSVGEYLNGTSIRAEVRYRIDAHGRETAGVHTGERKAFYEGVAALGLTIPIGHEPPPPPAEEEEPAEIVPVETVDSDNDGVPDDIDQCPETPAGAVVDENGCPPPEPEPDPVADCTPPSAGEPIDLNGCKAGDAIVLRGVTFELDSARLTPNAKVILDSVADALLAQQGISAEIGGYTSSEGSESHNQALSERRAESVKTYLVGRGVDAGRLEPKGYGEASPVADNSTEDGRELNRRVELMVTSSEAPAAASAEPEAAEEAEGEAEEAPAEDYSATEDTTTDDTATEEAPVEETPSEETPSEVESYDGEAEVESAQPYQ